MILVADPAALARPASHVSRADVVVVIPARYGSSRFIGKPLARIGDKPLVQQVYDRVSTVRGIKRIIVATDDERILTVVLFSNQSCNHSTGGPGRRLYQPAGRRDPIGRGFPRGPDLSFHRV